MRLYCPIAKVDAEARMVWGYASTEKEDDQGEVVRRGALQAALDDYMRFANIREMHQLSAVGKAKEAAVDDKGLYVGARIVDPLAWEKVQEGVYNGFSIGGKVTGRDPGDRRVITALKLDEISLVDRPANPEAVFDCWKRSGDMPEGLATMGDLVQIWDCGIAGHRHLQKAAAAQCREEAAKAAAGSEAASVIADVERALQRAGTALKAGDAPGEGAKPYGNVEYADPGYQDGKKRYPVDTEKHIRAAWSYINKPKNRKPYNAEQLKHIEGKIIAAWKDKIDPEGPPSAAKKAALAKALQDVGRVASILLELDWLKDCLATEAAVEGDDSPQPKRLAAIIEELCGFLNALVAEETEELLDDDDMGSGPGPVMIGPFGFAALAGALKKAGKAGLVEKLAKAGRHNMADQAHLDLAAYAVKAAMPMASKADQVHLGEVHKALLDAGAVAHGPAPEFAYPAGAAAEQHSTVDTGRNPESPTPTNPAGPGPVDPRTAKAGRAHQVLLDVAHHAVKAVSDGAVCDDKASAPARHSAETMAHLHKAHFHLGKAGAVCKSSPLTPSKGEEERQGTANSAEKAVLAERAEKEALVKTLAQVMPILERLSKRVEDIAQTPLPALTLRTTAGLARVEKSAVAGGNAGIDDVAKALSEMSEEEKALTLIKASYRKPIVAPGLATPAQLRAVAAQGEK